MPGQRRLSPAVALLLAGPVTGSARNHEYVYSVAPQYATAGRPAFDAKGGYAGSQLMLTVSKRYPKYWVGAFAAGVGIAWILGESSTRVEAVE